MANAIVEWLKAERLCDLDIANHQYLVENYPQATLAGASIAAVDEDTMVTPQELHPEGGENLDEEDDDFEEDHTDPTEKQKPSREVSCKSS